MQFRTRAIHTGQEPDPQTGAVIPPIHLATTFVQPGAHPSLEFDYSRSGNPTRKAFETTLAALEDGHRSLAFASGMAATHCVMMLLSPGDHVVASADLYGGTYRLLHKILERVDVRVSTVSTTDLQAVAAAFTPATKLLWVETPGNPLMSITDIAGCAKIAHEREALLGVDNTFATPALTRPLDLGADVVMHSATKYLGGHSDVLGGALVVNDRTLGDRLYYIQNATGAVMGPWDAFLCSRGLKTLELRVREQSRTAQKIAEYLAGHRRVRHVHYPGLPEHPGHDLAARQMEGAFGAMLSFEVDGELAQAAKIVESTQLFRLAVSLGAVESLIELPATMSHASYDAMARQAFGISDGLIRLSVGLEAFDDLRDDLEQALR
jgi:cystathionine gamma-lyase